MLSEIPFEPSASSEVIASLPACLRLRRGFSDLELADEPAPDVIRRLNPADGEGRLTNAVGLLLVATPCVGIDYMRRDVPGGTAATAPAARTVGPYVRVTLLGGELDPGDGPLRVGPPLAGDGRVRGRAAVD